MKFLKWIARFWKTILVLAIILVLCLIPAKDITKIDFLKISYEDLAVHLIMFFSFSSILFRDLQKNTDLLHRPAALAYTVLTLGLALGITTEMLQFLLTSLNRSADLYDLLFDLLGTGLGITGKRLIKR